jgi:hypothetical protein
LGRVAAKQIDNNGNDHGPDAAAQNLAAASAAAVFYVRTLPSSYPAHKRIMYLLQII